MTMTHEESALMARREILVPKLTNIIDRTIGELQEACKEAGLKPIGDDRLAKVEAAVIRFVLEAHEETHPHAK